MSASSRPPAIEALASFGGVRRRMQVRGEARGVTVYDDFAHHPTAIRTTLEGLRQRVGIGRILAVLEPRSNTMKRGVMKDALPPSLAQADRVYIYTAGLGWDARSLFALLGARARCEEDLEPWWRGGRRSEGRGPCAGHVQRRLRRHPRQTA